MGRCRAPGFRDRPGLLSRPSSGGPEWTSDRNAYGGSANAPTVYPLAAVALSAWVAAPIRSILTRCVGPVDVDAFPRTLRQPVADGGIGRTVVLHQRIRETEKMVVIRVPGTQQERLVPLHHHAGDSRRQN